MRKVGAQIASTSVYIYTPLSSVLFVGKLGDKHVLQYIQYSSNWLIILATPKYLQCSQLMQTSKYCGSYACQCGLAAPSLVDINCFILVVTVDAVTHNISQKCCSNFKSKGDGYTCQSKKVNCSMYWQKIFHERYRSLVNVHKVLTQDKSLKSNLNSAPSKYTIFHMFMSALQLGTTNVT